MDSKILALLGINTLGYSFKYCINDMSKEEFNKLISSATKNINITLDKRLLTMILAIIITIMTSAILIQYVLKFFSYKNPSLYKATLFMLSIVMICANFYENNTKFLGLLYNELEDKLT